MDLCDYKQIQALLAAADGFHFSRARGQNFLTERWVPERIADSCGLDARAGAVEIGVGVGCLTEQLALRAGKVLAFEVDEKLKPVLARTLAPYDNIEVVFGDVMRRDLRQEIESSLPDLRPVLCANLPYSITTPVLTKIFESRCFESAVVMVQREVALRMCAGAGDKDYGAFSLLTQWYTEPELLFDVGPECFVPRPKVTSSVVRMRMRTVPPVDGEEDGIFRVIRAAFGQRRKTLVNALDGLCGRERARKAVSSCGFSETVRGEALRLEDFAALAAALRDGGEA